MSFVLVKKINFNILLSTLVLFSLSSCLNTDLPKPDPAYEQLAKEITAIDEYLKANNQDYIAYSSSGVRLVIKQFGTDAPARNGQNINFSYVARTFDNNTAPYSSGTINSLIENVSVPGLTNWLKSLLKGTITTIYVPSLYAEGAPVAANTTLIFDVTINGITKTNAELSQAKIDSTVIKKFTSTITGLIRHSSGLVYSIDSIGSGVKPRVYDNVNFSYEGYTLTDSTQKLFEASTLNNINIFGLIDGLKIGIPLMNTGGIYTFYIPSGLAYGPTGSGTIKANSNLKFKVRLNSIIKN